MLFIFYEPVQEPHNFWTPAPFFFWGGGGSSSKGPITCAPGFPALLKKNAVGDFRCLPNTERVAMGSDFLAIPQNFSVNY